MPLFEAPVEVVPDRNTLIKRVADKSYGRGSGIFVDHDVVVGKELAESLHAGNRERQDVGRVSGHARYAFGEM